MAILVPDGLGCLATAQNFVFDKLPKIVEALLLLDTPCGVGAMASAVAGSTAVMWVFDVVMVYISYRDPEALYDVSLVRTTGKASLTSW